MLYHLLKPIVRTAMWIFCRKIFINKPALLSSEGPLLLACNHPNSFLDSVILDVLFEKPVWSLARGDVFKGRLTKRLLAAMKILPVYRTSEGVENLGENYKTFNDCIEIFKQKGIVQIFSEGKCINEWHLRPLKKGTARLAIKAWESGIPLKVLPVGINYSSFRRFGKNVWLNFGNIITRDSIKDEGNEGLRRLQFNAVLENEMKQLVYEIPKNNKPAQQQKLSVNITNYKKIFLALPAFLGMLIHAPLYVPLRQFTFQKANHNDHYDSILISLLLISYPFYILLLAIILYMIIGSWLVMIIFLALPLLAWAYVQLKGQIDTND